MLDIITNTTQSVTMLSLIIATFLIIKRYIIWLAGISSGEFEKYNMSDDLLPAFFISADYFYNNYFYFLDDRNDDIYAVSIDDLDYFDCLEDEISARYNGGGIILQNRDNLIKFDDQGNIGILVTGDDGNNYIAILDSELYGEADDTIRFTQHKNNNNPDVNFDNWYLSDGKLVMSSSYPQESIVYDVEEAEFVKLFDAKDELRGCSDGMIVSNNGHCYDSSGTIVCDFHNIGDMVYEMIGD